MEARQQLVTAAAVNKALNIPAGTLYLMARKGLIPFYKTGAKRRALRFDIEEVLQAIRQPAVSRTTIQMANEEAG